MQSNMEAENILLRDVLSSNENVHPCFRYFPWNARKTMRIHPQMGKNLKDLKSQLPLCLLLRSILYDQSP
jgi:hypothetical protein